MIVAGRYILQWFCLAAFLFGCAALPPRVPLSGSARALVRDSFAEMAGNQRQCKSSVDAAVTVTLASRFYSGTVSGFLQVKAPAYVKIVGVNPFGQPLALLVSDGAHFNYALLNERLSYEGSVDSDAFRRFAPSGFAPDNSFYTITGKLPPGEVRILAISNDSEGHGVWVEIEGVQDKIRRLVLFDPEHQLILRSLQFDEAGEVALQIWYSDYSPGACRLPGLITLASRDHSGELQVRLKDWQFEAPFSPADFELKLPPDFKRVKVN